MKLIKVTSVPLLAVLACQPALAEKPYLEQRVEDLEKEVRVLRERLDRMDAKPPVAVSPPQTAPAAPPDTPPLQPRWNKIKLGMTQIQVSQLLGEPASRGGEGYGERWLYPVGGYVEFDAASEVSGWQAPTAAR